MGGGQGLVLANSSHIPNTFLAHQSSAVELLTLKPGCVFTCHKCNDITVHYPAWSISE